MFPASCGFLLTPKASPRGPLLWEGSLEYPVGHTLPWHGRLKTLDLPPRSHHLFLTLSLWTPPRPGPKAECPLGP